jgi:ATP-dependent Zn protease
MMKYQRMQQERTALLNRGVRYWADAGDEDAAVAQHEAAHALVARLLGADRIVATIEAGAGFGGMTTWANEPTRVFDRVVIRVAGAEGEKLFGASSESCCKDDLAQARALASDAEIKRARRAARSIMKANFTALAALAVALIDRRTLDLAEIDEIIGGAGEPDRGSLAFYEGAR